MFTLAQACTAVGAYTDSSGTKVTLAERCGRQQLDGPADTRPGRRHPVPADRSGTGVDTALAETYS